MQIRIEVALLQIVFPPGTVLFGVHQRAHFGIPVQVHGLGAGGLVGKGALRLLKVFGVFLVGGGAEAVIVTVIIIVAAVVVVDTGEEETHEN